MKKRLTAAILGAVMAFVAVNPCYAAKSVSDLKKDLESSQQKVEETKKEIKKKQTEKNAQVSQRDALDIEIAGLQDDIDSIQAVISEKDAEIEKKNAEIAELDAQIEKTDKKLKKRMKVIYENGTTSYLEMIFSAKGISDLFTRISIVQSILKHDNAIIDDFEAKITEVEAVKTVIETEKNEQVEAKAILDKKQSEIEAKKAQKDELIKVLSNDINELKRQEAEMERAEREIQAQINAALGTAGQSSVQYRGNGKFILPIASYTRISSPYGYRPHPITGTRKLHTGIDYAAPYGTAIYAAEDGKVLTSGWINGYGYTVTINHGGGYVTLYAHCSKLLVSAGQTVTKGQTIAKVGSTGNSTGNHLHFEVKVNGAAQNPANYL